MAHRSAYSRQLSSQTLSTIIVDLKKKTTSIVKDDEN